MSLQSLLLAELDHLRGKINTGNIQSMIAKEFTILPRTRTNFQQGLFVFLFEDLKKSSAFFHFPGFGRMSISFLSIAVIGIDQNCLERICCHTNNYSSVVKIVHLTIFSSCLIIMNT